MSSKSNRLLAHGGAHELSAVLMHRTTQVKHRAKSDLSNPGRDCSTWWDPKNGRAISGLKAGGMIRLCRLDVMGGIKEMDSRKGGDRICRLDSMSVQSIWSAGRGLTSFRWGSQEGGEKRGASRESVPQEKTYKMHSWDLGSTGSVDGILVEGI